MNKNRTGSGYKYGSLPDRAPLAAAYVPMQESVSPSYEPSEALARGTLFPGLDLPFMNVVNNSLPVCPKTELMAISFVADELGLYLDTHAEDKEAFSLYKTFLALEKEAEERYRKLYGPVMKDDMLCMDSYDWLNDPWPWDYIGNREG